MSLEYTPDLCVTAIDTVMGGDVLRIVLSGMPELAATSPLDALRELRRNHDDFRRFVIEHPRGNEAINACLLLPPFSPEAARTFIVAPQFGYAPIAGTPLMAAAATLIEVGEVSACEPVTKVLFDTAKGPAEVEVNVEDGRCTSTRWLTARPTVVTLEQQFVLEDGRSISASVISPGLPYAIVRVSELGVCFEDTVELGAAGAMVSRALGEQLPLHSIGMEEDASDYHVMAVGEIRNEDLRSAAVEVACISPTGWVSATPAGTGAISVATYFNELGETSYGSLMEIYTPSGNRFRCSVDADNACVDATFEIVALLELVMGASKNSHRCQD